MKLAIGDLCYVPQNVTLVDEYDGVPRAFITTKKPHSALYIGKDSEHSNWIKILLSGTEWYVQHEAVYPWYYPEQTEEVENVS